MKNSESGWIVSNLIHTIQDNKQYLSEIDGKIGDGDHGINMNKGFTMAESKLSEKNYGLKESLWILAETLQEDIGGSMGPLYGVFFEEMSEAVEDDINEYVFLNMIKNGLEGVQSIGNAQKGDKTLLDTLIPAVEAFEKSVRSGESFQNGLKALKREARKGWQETEGMIAKIGRASRLGERSKGVLDAGATSCYLILESFADSLLEKM